MNIESLWNEFGLNLELILIEFGIYLKFLVAQQLYISIRYLSFFLWKSEQNLANKIWQNQNNQIKPKIIKHKYSFNQTKPNSTEPNQTKLNQA